MSSFYSEQELVTLGLKKYGENVLISRNACIYGSKNIEIGNNVRIDDFCILSGNIIIGDYVHVAAAVLLFGGVSGIVLEDFTGISSRCAVYADSDDYTGLAMTNPTIPEKYRKISGGKVVIKKHALIGTGCTVLPGVILETGCSVGSMSLVSKNLEEWSMYVGIPCKKIKDRNKDIIEIEHQFLREKNK